MNGRGFVVFISYLISVTADLIELVPSNDLNPLMDPRSLTGEYQQRATTVKDKHVPDYMMDMFTLQKKDAGFSFENARNYEALSGC